MKQHTYFELMKYKKCFKKLLMIMGKKTQWRRVLDKVLSAERANFFVFLRRLF